MYVSPLQLGSVVSVVASALLFQALHFFLFLYYSVEPRRAFSVIDSTYRGRSTSC